MVKSCQIQMSDTTSCTTRISKLSTNESLANVKEIGNFSGCTLLFRKANKVRKCITIFVCEVCFWLIWPWPHTTAFMHKCQMLYIVVPMRKKYANQLLGQYPRYSSFDSRISFLLSQLFPLLLKYLCKKLIICVLLVLDNWKCCSWELGPTAQHFYEIKQSPLDSSLCMYVCNQDKFLPSYV